MAGLKSKVTPLIGTVLWPNPGHLGSLLDVFVGHAPDLPRSCSPKSFSYRRSYFKYIGNVDTRLINHLPPHQKVQKIFNRFWSDQSPQIKRHLGLRTTGQVFPITQQQNDCDWPIPRWGCLIGVGLLHTPINQGRNLDEYKAWPLAKRGCLIGGC